MFALRDSLKSEHLNWSDPNPFVWTGLRCDTRSHRVTRIEIGNRGISRTLTCDLRNLSSLAVFDVMGNNLTGKIPSLAGLKSLERVLVNDNSHVLFNVSGNKLTGIIPESIFKLSSLSYVGLGNNLLQGPKPGLLPEHDRFDRRCVNNFCLDVPGAPCDMRVNALLLTVEGFGFPVVFSESWKGNDPCNGMWIGITCTGADVTVINFKGMGLTGVITPSFVLLKDLMVINLSHKNLTGFIPQELTRLSKLKTLDVSYNQLDGQVPDFRTNVVDTTGNPVPRPIPGSIGPSAGKIVGSVIGGNVSLLLLIGFAIFLCGKITIDGKSES
ncbi:hypothetical protein Bca52824_066522 [Brassica carinata]|uniref:Leucine-rich repeat-containing N-terminal plant-type domain-containing protein n=1 Tax=Brassica carinata TaxID=52824 RepID=A0A8X7UAQ6_BRACI|nr:hypothetical protein Bca52824_066522 [Brassica carinata]